VTGDDADGRIADRIAAVRQAYRPVFLARLENLERALLAAEGGTLEGDTREHARRSAHSLAGSLGTFGLDGSDAARRLERWLGQDPSPGDGEVLARGVAALRRALGP